VRERCEVPWNWGCPAAVRFRRSATGRRAGGAAGVAIGAATVTAYARGHGEAVIIPPQAWAGGLAATVIIGALAGLLPAIRAARLSPTQALWTV
jgi:ABC-type antimicrobial peptide transport system permease subunit